MNNATVKCEEALITNYYQNTSGLLGSARDYDYNNALRLLITKSLGRIPEVGTLLNAIATLLWPKSKIDVWGEIKNKVEDLIHKEISKEVYNTVQDDLTGINNNISKFLYYLNNSTDTTRIARLYDILDNDFLQQRPHFQSHGYKVLLLPLFTQFANLHLGLMRDGDIYGESWGWTKKDHDHQHEQFIQTIQDYSEYVEDNFNYPVKKIKKRTKRSDHDLEPFYAMNQYVRDTTLSVLYFKEIWNYFDTDKYPHPVEIYLNREIYTNPHGTADDSGQIKLPSPPTQPISEVKVWGWDRIDACEVYYPEGGGPDGKTTTGRMGDKDGGSSKSPEGGHFHLNSDKYITKVQFKSGDIVNALKLEFNDGSKSSLMGGLEKGGNRHAYSYKDEIVSSIKINGISKYYGSADCILFGFKFLNGIKPDKFILKTLSDLFDKDDKAHAKLEIGKLIEKENWRKERKEFWGK